MAAVDYRFVADRPWWSPSIQDDVAVFDDGLELESIAFVRRLDANPAPNAISGLVVDDLGRIVDAAAVAVGHAAIAVDDGIHPGLHDNLVDIFVVELVAAVDC